MSIYVITYDLKKPGQQYSQLYEEIKNLGDWWHYLESTWLVNSSLSPDQIWDRIANAKTVDSNDHVLIIAVTRPYQGWLPKEAWDWINARL